MNSKKKILSFLLSFVMIISMFPMTDISVFASDENITDYLTCEINDGEVVITDCDESVSGDVVIPDTIDGCPVTAIGEYAFADCHDMESVFIPSSVTSLGWCAFTDGDDGCRSLKSVVIEGSDIEYAENEYGYSGNTFKQCNNLESVIIGEGVKTIADNMFAYCFNLKDIQLPESLTEIADGSFSMCISLEEISLPASLETIGNSAFSDCYSIENIVLPDSVTFIGEYAFVFCINIESINIPSGLSVLDEGVLSGCYSLGSISIPSAVKSINEGAIESCLSLEDIYIYNPLADIDDRAIDTAGVRFTDITAAEYADMFAELNKMYVSDDYTEEEIAEKEQEFSDATEEVEDCILEFVIHGYNNSTASFYAQQNEIAFEAFENAPDSSLFLSYEIVDGEVTITDCYDQFSGDMVIPETIEGCPVTAIADEAFAEVYLLESIFIPETVTSIGAGAFSSCFCLNDINIPSAVTEIKDYTFISCYSLEEITLPDGITAIGEGAFSECVLLKRINIPAQIKTIGYDAFSGCMLIEKIDLPASIEFLGEYAFGSAFLVTDLYFYNPDTVIGDDLIPEESMIAPSMTTKEFAETYAKILAESTLLYIKGATEEEQNAFFEKYEDFFDIEPEDTTSVIVIHGYEGSTAQAYAEENGLFFVPFAGCLHLNTEFSNIVETTCSAEGFTGDLYCSDCGEKVADGKAVPVVPFHTFGEWKEVTAATCTQKGTKARECVFCKNATEEEPIDAKGHTDENSDDICDVCSAETCYVIHVDETITVGYENIVALVKFVPEVSGIYSFGSISDGYNNTYGYLYDADMNELTCNDDSDSNGNFLIEYSLIAGETYYFGCRFFDTYISGSFDVSLKKLHEHDCDETVTYPTCTDGGYTAFVCKTCGESFVGNRVAATGHNVVVIDGVAPTCTQTGLTEGKHCEECGEVFAAQEAVGALGHDYNSVVTAPTCEENGYTTHNCTGCDDSYVDTYTESLGHDWEDTDTETCKNCGEAEEEKLPVTEAPDNNAENWFVRFWRAISEFFERLFRFFRNGSN